MLSNDRGAVGFVQLTLRGQHRSEPAGPSVRPASCGALRMFECVGELIELLRAHAKAAPD
jgi:hypothetical protein